MSLNKSTLELSISGRNFAQTESNKTDPQCIIYAKTITDKRYAEIGRTEVIRGTRNPNWSVKVTIAYKFNLLQLLKFEVWDYDICADNELLGQFEIPLCAVVAIREQCLKKRLKLFSDDGRFTVNGELWVTLDEITAAKQIVDIQFQAKALTRKDILGSSDPYFVVSKEYMNDIFIQVYKSEVIYNTLDPKWSKFSLRLQDLCDADYDKLLKIDCFDWDRYTHDDCIGSFKTCLNTMLNNFPKNNIYELLNDHSAKNSDFKYKYRKSVRNANSGGFFALNSINVRQTFTFYEYIRRGTQIHFMCAIDLTQESIWYHHIDTNNDKANHVELVMRSLGEIIQCYDYQGLHSVFGFGAKLLPSRDLSHNFNLNLNSILPYCDRVEDMIQCYRSAFKAIEPDGPRHFASVINHVSNVSKNFQDGKHYFVLTIITSGCNSDISDTLEAIVNSSAMPVSIIFIGIGNCSFHWLKNIDGDAMTSRGQRTWRNNLQFSVLKNYINPSFNWEETQKKLANDLLQAIPKQVIDFMEIRNYGPYSSPSI